MKVVAAIDSMKGSIGSIEAGTAAKAGIKAIVQPGGSIRDEDSIKACNEKGVSMMFVGMRHFKH